MYSCDSDNEIQFNMNSPQNMMYNNRLDSYKKRWPQSLKYLTEPLTEAGFYYTQKGDAVQCFCCGISLKNWNDGDQPWEQHALLSPKCDFLNMAKGYKYVNFIREKQVVKV